MAAAATATKKTTVKAARSKTTTGTLKGLQLSAAQWKAYTSASSAAMSATRTRIALNASATRFRSYRLQSARATVAKYNAANRSVQAQAVATFAVRQSYLQSRNGHQNANLQARIHADYQRHVTILGRLQYARGGERKYATAAVMRTVTQGQALSYEKKVFALAAKTARKAATTRTYKSTITKAQSASIVAAGQKAGLAAARNPRAVKAPAPWMPRREGRWAGRPDREHCGPAAVVNAMLYHTGYRPGRLFFRRLERACGPEVTIPEALRILKALLLDGEHPVQLTGYRRVPVGMGRVPGHIVGYRERLGQHAALSLPGSRIVSWGMEIPYDGVTEEAWHITWRKR